MAKEAWVEDVLGFWFEELEKADWFKSSDELDARIVSRFGELHETLSGSTPQVERDARAALAAVIVLDQFSRNIYRGSARAFAQDAAALSLTRDAMSLGLDRQLDERHRHFLYMPFMHSEVLEAHSVSVELFKDLLGGEINDFAVDHRAIIEKFGRYPHRNAVLGRESTPEEVEYLEGAETYGQ